MCQHPAGVSLCDRELTGQLGLGWRAPTHPTPASLPWALSVSQRWYLRALAMVTVRGVDPGSAEGGS